MSFVKKMKCDDNAFMYIILISKIFYLKDQSLKKKIGFFSIIFENLCWRKLCLKLEDCRLWLYLFFNFKPQSLTQIEPNTGRQYSRVWLFTISYDGTYLSSHLCSNFNSVKPVYNDHPRDPKIVAVVDRWSLFGGHLYYKRSNWDFKIVAAVDKWLLFGGGR